MKILEEGEYNLNNLKEISVTDSFMELNRDIRNCQNIKSNEHCKEKFYVENLMQECGCLPLSLRLTEKVII